MIRCTQALWPVSSFCSRQLEPYAGGEDTSRSMFRLAALHVLPGALLIRFPQIKYRSPADPQDRNSSRPPANGSGNDGWQGIDGSSHSIFTLHKYHLREQQEEMFQKQLALFEVGTAVIRLCLSTCVLLCLRGADAESVSGAGNFQFQRNTIHTSDCRLLAAWSGSCASSERVRFAKARLRRRRH